MNTPEQFIFARDQKDAAIKVCEKLPGSLPLKQQLELAWINDDYQLISELSEAVRVAEAKHKAANTRSARERPYHEPTAIERLTAFRQR